MSTKTLALQKIIMALAMFLIYVQCAMAQSNDSYVNQIMAGMSNKGRTNNKEYLTAGDRVEISVKVYHRFGAKYTTCVEV